jgi:hypothetical protein
MDAGAPMNPYEAPKAELDSLLGPSMPANIVNAVEGRYQFTVGEVMDEAWRLVKGMKASFWGAAVLIGLIYMVASAMVGVLVMTLLPNGTNAVVRQVFNSVLNILLTPLTVGLEMMCVRRALGLPFSFSTAFEYFPKLGPILAGAFLVTLFAWLGTLALIIPGIYLIVGYELVTKLICDQNLSPWKAMETSRKAIGHRWWSVFGLGLLVALLTGLSALGLLIPLIWTIPWSMMTTAVLYRRIFYAQTPTVDDVLRS